MSLNEKIINSRVKSQKQEILSFVKVALSCCCLTRASKLTQLYINYLDGQDSSIVVAFDEIPEDGLNSPLRLEKVANEVLPFLLHIVVSYSYHEF
jgi:hypothetical protein